MTTLAGAKMRRFREAQSPKLSREEFGRRYGLPGPTVLGLEDQGKRPRRADVVNKLAADGIADHADWYLPATCPRCQCPADAGDAANCHHAQCPIAEAKAA